jgi:tRNA-Thr(GGU) m(6)t(6)A37 methyltransferase TsaA
MPGLSESAWGKLVFEDGFRHLDFVRGLEGFSHIWLIFGFHQTAAQGWRPTVRPPRLGGNERVGVFASRSTFRPNGLGLSLVRLEQVEIQEDGPVLWLGGVDVVSGTPVYDIKPYLPYAESIPDARAGYARDALEWLDVVVTQEAEPLFAMLSTRDQQVISEVLSLDPRPAVQQADENRIFGAELCGWDVRFRVKPPVCEIVSLTRGV